MSSSLKYGISPAWQEYYDETEPDRRFQMLGEVLGKEPDDGSDTFREKLFSLRYVEEGNQKPSVDRYLWQCVNFVQIYSTSRFFKAGGRKEVAGFLSGYGYEEALQDGINGQRALYWEIRNTAKRYFKTCMGKEYRRSLFGFLSPVEADQKKQLSLDVWKMTDGLAVRLGMQEKLGLWKQAVQDAYRQFDPEGAARLGELSGAGALRKET